MSAFVVWMAKSSCVSLAPWQDGHDRVRWCLIPEQGPNVFRALSRPELYLTWGFVCRFGFQLRVSFFFCFWLLLGFRTLSGRRFFRTRYAREVWSCKVFSSLGYSMGAASTNWLMTRLSGSGYPALRARLPGVKHNHIVAINISSQLNLNIDSWTWDQDSMFPLGCIPTIPVLSCQQQRYSRSTDGICRLWMVGTIRRWDCPWIPVLPCWFEDAVHHHGRHCCGLQNLSFIPVRSLSETR